MKNVRILVRSQTSENSQHVHARLLLWRGEDWHVCGVFQLLRPEWVQLAAFAAAQSIEIVNEQAPTAIPADPTTAAV